jgi:hypothetical protein
MLLNFITFLAESRREDEVVFFAVVVLALAAGCFVAFLGAGFLVVAARAVVDFALVSAALVVVEGLAIDGFLVVAGLAPVVFLTAAAVLVGRIVDLAVLVDFGATRLAAAGLETFEAGLAVGLFYKIIMNIHHPS